MLTLALETATEHTSLVLAEDDREVAAWRAACPPVGGWAEESKRRRVEQAELPSGSRLLDSSTLDSSAPRVARHDLCRRLAPEIADLLARAGRSFGDLDLLAVGLGPGYFTSLRIGLATAKAIALARDLPLLGISSLAAMAWQVRDRLSGLACPMLDARRGEIYAALYRLTRDSIEVAQPEFVAAPAALARLLGRSLSSCPTRGRERPTLFGQVDRLPTEEIAQAVGEHADLWRHEIVVPDALSVAQLARRRHAASPADDAASLRPIYVRMSYAEERSDIDLGLR